MSEHATDFKIVYDGTWYHEGAPIKREALAKLFSDRALKMDEEGRYWLQTPFEKYPVEVEDVPYVAVRYENMDGGICFFTNMDEKVFLSESHPLELRDGVPYVEVRDGLYARIARSVFYHLVQEFGAQVESGGVVYKLGDVDG